MSTEHRGVSGTDSTLYEGALADGRPETEASEIRDREIAELYTTLTRHSHPRDGRFEVAVNYSEDVLQRGEPNKLRGAMDLTNT
jgi:hypothetical protein